MRTIKLTLVLDGEPYDEQWVSDYLEALLKLNIPIHCKVVSYKIEDE